MIGKIQEKFKEISSKDNSKKFMTNLTVLIFLGIALILLSNSFTETKVTNSNNTDHVKEEAIEETLEEELIGDYEKKIKHELKEILSEIKGVGEVKIMVSLEDTAERIPAFNTTTVNENTNENDSTGGARKVVREDLKQEVVTAGGDSLMIIKEVKPNVKGVIVVAEGAEDIIVKEKLYSAVKTVLGISGNKVEVYSSK